METLVSSALMIRLSLHPSPDSETSAFNNIRAFSRRCAGLFPFRRRASSCSRSSPLSRTTYFEKFAEMIDRHWDGIAAYCRLENKVSLGFVEGLNNKIRVIQRRAYGFAGT